MDAGIDGFAHLVRDKEMDDALVASIVRRNVYVMPNLSPERNTYTELPHWLKEGDPLLMLLQESVSPPVIDADEEDVREPGSGGCRTDARAVRHPSAQLSRNLPGPTRRSSWDPIPALKITSSVWPNSVNWKIW